MNLGIFSPVFHDKSLEEVLQFLNKNDIKELELGCGGYPGITHCNAVEYIQNPKKIEELKILLAKYDVKISALSTHGNPVHPQEEIRNKANNELEAAMELANILGVKTIITFSGCPGDHENAKYPNWVTCAWPNEYQDILDYQWNKVLIPYWQEISKKAESYNVNIAIEIHPGFSVYNTETMKKLHQVGKNIGVNLDPSHLIWQGMDPCKVAMELKDMIYHVHAKDTEMNIDNTKTNGVLDTKSYQDELNRSWIFRTVGYGNGELFWKKFFSTLSLLGYEGSVSIEHEDSLIEPLEGLNKAIQFLKNVMITSGKLKETWWI